MEQSDIKFETETILLVNINEKFKVKEAELIAL